MARHFVAHFILYFVEHLMGKRPDEVGDKVEDEVGRAPTWEWLFTPFSNYEKSPNQTTPAHSEQCVIAFAHRAHHGR